MTAFGRFLLAYRAPIAALLLLLFGASLHALRSLEFDLSLSPIVISSDEEAAQLASFQDEVPPQLYDVQIVLTWPRPIDRAELDQLAALVDEIAVNETVADVTSLATMPVVPPGAALPLPVPFPDTLTDGRTVLEEVNEHPLLARRLLSADGCATAMIVTFHGSKEPAVVGEQVVVFRDWLAPRLPPEVEMAALGGAVVERTMARSMQRDMGRTVTLELIACALLLPLLMRTARGSILPLGVVVIAIALSLGSFSIAGVSISVLDLAIPGLITIIGLCDAIHMMHRFEAAFGRTNDRTKAIVEMMSRVGAACFQTSLTTGLGFLSLLISDHDAVRAFGWKASLSVGVTFLTVVIALPLALSVWPIRRAGTPAMKPLRGVRVGSARLPLLVAGAVLLVSLIGAARVVVDSHWLEELPQDSPEVVALRDYEERFQGILWMEIQLEGEIDRPDVLLALERMQDQVVALADEDSSESVTMWIRELLGNPERVNEADMARGLGFLRLAGDAFPAHLVDREFRRGRVTFQTSDIGTRRFLILQDRITELLTALPNGIDAAVAGPMKTAHESSRLVITTMLESFLLSLLAITIFVAVIYRSIRLGLISVLPNLLPILVALGLNGWLDIPLRIGIVMIYALGLGLAVDDTIHLITRYVQERKDRPEASVRECLDTALAHTGKALVATSMILSVGCLCYLPSDFRSMRDVGILLNAVVLSAVIADLFLLPHLIMWVERRSQKPSTSLKTTT